MKQFRLSIIFLLCFTSLSFAQEFVQLPYDTIEGVDWKGGEKEYYSDIWQTPVITNVSKPIMQVFRPVGEVNNGTAVIVAPGGGLYAHSITKEGNDVAKWLNQKGITAFVLKYRLVPTGDDGVGELEHLATTNPQKIGEEVAKVMPYSIQDGLNAISHVREKSNDYGIDLNKIGFMGFSAGGAVTMGVGYNYTKENRPNFLVPVYPWTDVMPIKNPREDAPPMLIVCATDDPIGLAKGSVELYSSMFAAQKSVALHMYAKGGHGFGMQPQGLPSDKWIERFYEWAIAQNLATPTE